MEPHQPAAQQARQVGNVRDLTWSELELVVERRQSGPYTRRILDGVLPLVYGVLLGLAGALLALALVFSFALRTSRSDEARLLRLSRRARVKTQRHRRHSPARFPCDPTPSESDLTTPGAAPLRARRPPAPKVCGCFPGGDLDAVLIARALTSISHPEGLSHLIRFLNHSTNFPSCACLFSAACDRICTDSESANAPRSGGSVPAWRSRTANYRAWCPFPPRLSGNSARTPKAIRKANNHDNENRGKRHVRLPQQLPLGGGPREGKQQNAIDQRGTSVML
ncbi:hypothetical protein AAFF_G00249120 [Aldrovandia affinis]|uniref:Uncharacterized protein n=1 Tax=Aldrovandia affinis TaxID=143900 RepID=A0AAD7RDF5_9TELE|nr:hypothetical protein AAFF_G00249120 [Aldrovandia affinis]